MNEIVVVKIGGSVITEKEAGSLTVKMGELGRIIDELKSAGVSTILVHGGGSFGHTVAKQYSVHMGKTHSTPNSASRVMNSMVQLNHIVMGTMIDRGLAPLSLPPHAMLGVTMSFDRKQIRLISLALQQGFTPVLYGDVVLDNKNGFKIVSGDYIAAELAILLRAKRLVFGTNVDGVYRRLGDPASLYTQIDRHTRFKTEVGDVTGGIRYKVTQGLRAASAGIETLIVNATRPDNIRKAVLGEQLLGTKIVWE